MSLLEKYEQNYDVVSTKILANLPLLMGNFVLVNPEYTSQIDNLINQAHNFIVCSTARSLYYGLFPTQPPP